MDFVGNEKVNRKNPRATAGLLSVLTFAWTFKLFQTGFRRALETSDLCEPLPEHTAQLLGDKFEELWNKEIEAYKENPKRRPSLIRVIFKAYVGQILFYIIVTYLGESIFRLAQPFLLSRLIQYFTPNTTVTFYEAKLYAGGVVLCMLGNLLITPLCTMANSHLGMKVRVATCSLIYRKSLRLSQEASSKMGAGQIVNILSNDVSRFDNVLLFLSNVMLGPIITAVVAYVIWLEAGMPALIGFTIIIVSVVLQSVLAKRTATLRARIAVKTDNRIRLMNEILAGIQVIKMYAWEKSFAKLVALARKKEVDTIREKAYALGFLNTTSAVSTKLALFVSLIAYASYSHTITVNVVFVMILCYKIVEDNLIRYLPKAISRSAESYVSVRRIETFLMSEEATEAIVERPPSSASNGEIEIKDLCARWTSSEQAENTLDHLNVRIQPGSLVAVIGAVGSGKSSLLQLILRELPARSGIVHIGGTVSYASQEPWLFGGTVCQNILFGLPMDKEKYQKVVRVCALEQDFKQLPYGDKTTIGDRGACLSGGQRARINLARAVYRDADIYLLDDPLSAVDSHVSKHLYEECICGYLSRKTVMLTTHNVQRLTNVSYVIKMDGGKVAAQGPFKKLCDIGYYVTSLEESMPSEKDEQEERKTVQDESPRDLQKDTEMRSKGSGGASVYLAYLKAAKTPFLVACAISTFILVIVATSGSDYWLSFWVNKEEYVFPEVDHITVPLLGELNRNICMSVYGILIGTLTTLVILRTFLYIIMCMRASTNLHDTMFRSISHATMNFFNTTPTGQILNRFSRDTGIIDEELSETLSDYISIGLQVVGSLFIIFVVNWYLIAPFIVITLILYALRTYYVATSKSIKLVESIARSRTYTHVNTSLQGLPTIRAMHAQSRLHQEFDQKMDAQSSARYYFLGANRAFVYYLQLTCCLCMSAVLFSFLVLDSDFLGGDVGLAITQTMGLTFLFQACIRCSADLENYVTSLELVCELGKVESECKYLATDPEKDLHKWPSRGVIQFSDVSLFYDAAKPAVLKNISFDVRSGEKIGVVGRTGAGKSSLIAALYRLQKIEGKITIDGIETSTIGLQDLRSRISIIPQDPVIFSGSMRFNLDPFDEYDDMDLWNVLEEVKLKSIVQDNPGGLSTKLSEGGVNLSVGQRQLVCLARAILRNSAVLVLDEATANVDAETDNFIQAAIRKRFAHCTVITIAHRLHTIMDSDRILVMDNGRIAEFGPPQVLLLDRKGYFTHLVELVGLLNSIAIQQNKSFKRRPSG